MVNETLKSWNSERLKCSEATALKNSNIEARNPKQIQSFELSKDQNAISFRAFPLEHSVIVSSFELRISNF